MTEHDEHPRGNEYHRGGVQARHEPDTLGAIVTVARAHGCAPATKIVMRQVVWERIMREQKTTLWNADGIPLEIDETIPMFPGFQIHREVW